MNRSTFRSRGRMGVAGLALGLVLIGTSVIALPTSAQSVARLVLSGVPPVLDSPFVSDIESTYRQGRYPLQLVYTDPSGQPAAIRFRVELMRNGRTVLDVTSLPATFPPGVHILRTFSDPFGVAFPGGYPGVVQRATSGFRDQVQRAGRLPDGAYDLTIEPIVGDGTTLAVTLPATVFFEVQTAEPPVLISPGDGDLITGDLPIFSWTPASRVPAGAVVEYELTIAEVLQGQTVEQALRSGTPYFRRAFLGLTTFAYTRAQIPFEPGRRYAWRVQARDPLGRLTFLDDGRTENYTFTTPAAPQGRAITWRYPLTNPVLEFEIPDAVPQADGLFVSGRYQGTVDGVPQTATFDNVLLDPVTLAIVGGAVRIGGRPLEEVIR